LLACRIISVTSMVFTFYPLKITIIGTNKYLIQVIQFHSFLILLVYQDGISSAKLKSSEDKASQSKLEKHQINIYPYKISRSPSITFWIRLLNRHLMHAHFN